MALLPRCCATASNGRVPTSSICRSSAFERRQLNRKTDQRFRTRKIMTTTTRIFNFSAGPAILPVEVLEQAQRDLLSLPGVGMSILEISHRSKPFDDIIEGCEADLRALAGVPDGYHVLFLQGGASLQFSMVPMNLLSPQGSADYIVTGAWSQKAVKEAKRVGGVKIAASTEGENFTRVPRQEELTLDPNAAYVHYTTNNTIFGTEFHYIP